MCCDAMRMVRGPTLTSNHGQSRGAGWITRRINETARVPDAGPLNIYSADEPQVQFEAQLSHRQGPLLPENFCGCQRIFLLLHRSGPASRWE
jgi:hypothetical protein